MAYVRRIPKAEQTMSAIVAAAMDIGTRRGLQHVTLNAVATTVGITRAGVFARVGAIWLAIGALVVFGLGIMLAVTAGKPTVTRE